MGTRNLTMVKSDGVIKIAQYGQWDGYPTGQGEKIRMFLSNADLPTLQERLANKPPFISDGEYEDLMESIGLRNRRFINMEEAELFDRTYPSLSRNTGADILQLIYVDPTLPLVSSIDFGFESLFCEWGYFIDLDEEKVTIYKGFQEDPLTPGERFYTETPSESGYYGIRAVRSFSIPTFITLDMEELEAMIEEEEEEND